jgi:hypothetical protein
MLAAPTDWVHINEPPGDRWIIPVWQEVNAAIAIGQEQRRAESIEG